MPAVDLGAEPEPVAERAARERLRKWTRIPRRHTLIPLMASVVLLVPSFVWIARDRSIWPWDPAWYGQVSIDLWAALRLSPGTWWGAMVHAFGAKPPAIAWLGQFFVPWGHKLGSTEISLLVSVIAGQIGVLALVYVSAVRQVGGRIGAVVVATLLAASAPLFVALSHEYFPEPIQTVAVGWAVLIMVSAPRWRPSLTIVQLAGAIAFGLLTKLSTPLYQAAPAAVALVGAWWLARPQVQRVWYRDVKLVFSALGAAALGFAAASWYAVNFDSARQHAELSQSSLYGAARPFWASLGAWFHRLVDSSFLPYMWLAVAIPLAAGAAAMLVPGAPAVRLRVRRPGAIGLYGALCVAASIATVVVVLTLFARQPNNETRYLLPLIPCVALIVAGLFAALPSSRWAWLAAAGLAAEFVLANLIALGTISVASMPSPRLVPPVRPAFASELERIVRSTCVPKADGKISMVGTDYPWLNFNTLSLLADERYALIGRHCYYTSLGYAEQDSKQAWERLIQFNPPYFVSLDYRNRDNRLPSWITRATNFHDAFNRVNVAVYDRLIVSGRFVLVPGSRRDGVVIYRARSFRATAR